MNYYEEFVKPRYKEDIFKKIILTYLEDRDMIKTIEFKENILKLLFVKHDPTETEQKFVYAALERISDIPKEQFPLIPVAYIITTVKGKRYRHIRKFNAYRRKLIRKPFTVIMYYGIKNNSISACWANGETSYTDEKLKSNFIRSKCLYYMKKLARKYRIKSYLKKETDDINFYEEYVDDYYYLFDQEFVCDEGHSDFGNGTDTYVALILLLSDSFGKYKQYKLRDVINV